MSVAVIINASSSAWARLEGVDWIKLNVQGTSYDVPLYNPKFAQEMYLIKRAIEEKDRVAREIVLGGKEEKYIFIGDGDTNVWLIMNKDSESIKVV